MNQRRWLIYRLFAMVIALGLLVPIAAHAQTTQTATDVVINYAQATDTPDQGGVTLDLYFTLVDATRQVVPNVDISSASFILDPEDGGTTDAKVSKATGPISMVLVLDTSGSMSSKIKDMQNAAIQLVQNAPQDSQFAVIQFSDKVNLIQDFTNDKNRVANAITSQLKAGGATCLYDAIYGGVDQLSKAVPGRRAVVVFTDGKDETASGKLCSTKTVDDIVALATSPQGQTPIYSIGLRGSQPIAEDALRNISQSTGGTVSLGTDLNAMFKVITDALNAQMVAEALIHPRAGSRHVTLRVNMTDTKVTPPNDASTIFISPKDYSVRPTATPSITPTPIPLQISIDTVQEDPSTGEFVLSISTKNEEQVKEYHIDLINPDGVLQQEVVVPAPMKSPVNLKVDSQLPPGEFTIRVIAYASDNSIVGRSNDWKLKYSPTPTATFTPTGTPQPISATITQISYDDPNTKGNIVVSLDLLGKDQITRLSATLSDARTGITQRTFDNLTVDTTVTLSMTGLPPAEYNVNIYTYGANGQQTALSTQRFVHSIEPTATITPSATATVVVVSVAIGAPQIDLNAQTFTFGVQAQNQTLISTYDVQVINEDTTLLQKEYKVQVPPYDSIKIPFADLQAGKYTITLQALDANGNPLGQPAQVRFVYTPPTETPTPVPTDTPTPEPTGLIPALGKAVSDPNSRPIVLIVFFLIIAGIIGGIVYMVRNKPKKPTTGTSFLREMTGAVDLSQLAGYEESSKATSAQDRDKTAPAPIIQDREKTSPVPYISMPTATITVENSRDSAMIGKTATIEKSPFTMGRLKRDLNFNNDDNVSREHAEITYDNDTFYIIDKGSTHHTYLDDVEVPANTRKPLYNNATIRLGTATVLRFKTDQGGGYFMDRTSAEPFRVK